MVVWYGTGIDDTKSGTSATDYLDGGDGNDTLFGLGDNDILHGQDGDDTLYGGGGDDYIYGWKGADDMFGGDGNDYIVTGRPDFFGTPGGVDGSDVADGGDGVDAITISWWNQLINGEETSITLDFGDGNFTVHGGGSDWEVCTNFEQLAYYGSEGGDIITGGSSDDLFRLGGGNDVLRAMGGNDYIYDNGGVLDIDGGPGIDTLELDTLTLLSEGVTFKLHPGADAEIAGGLSGTVKNVEALFINWNSGTSYDDHFAGGDYDDTIYSGGGNDTIDGGGGNDHLGGQNGDDVIHGGGGNDNLEGGGFPDIDNWYSGSDTIYGDAGNDSIHGGVDGGSLYGGDGNDGIDGSESADILYGGTGDDRLNGGGSDDQMYGGAGNDSIGAGEGADVVDGGSGNDTVTYQGSFYGVTVDLLRPQDNTDQAAGDTYVSIENIDGAVNADDILRGSDVANVLNGYWGNDVFEGRGGADTLIGDSGIDTASYLHADKGVTANLTAPHTNKGDAAGDTYSSIENLEGSRFKDTLTGDGNVNSISAGAGNDILKGLGGGSFNGGGDVLTGGGGDDTFAYAAVADSTGVVFDIITDFDAKADQFDVIKKVTGIDHKVTHGHLSLANFDNNLHAALQGELGKDHAVLFTPDGGDAAFHGHTFLVVDQNGTAGYQAGADLVMDITGAHNLGNLTAADFTT